MSLFYLVLYLHSMWTSAKHASKAYGVTGQTLRTWAKSGKIQSTQTDNAGPRRYFIETPFVGNAGAESKLPGSSDTDSRDSYIYARVSSAKQKYDLGRQIELLQQHYPNHKTISDVGSGINFKRPGLDTLLERISQGFVKQIVVLQRDRLCRFAFDLMETICRFHGTKIVVFESNPDKSDASELAEDLLAINTVFICRLQGKRAGLYRRQRSLLGLPRSGNSENSPEVPPTKAPSKQGRKIPLEDVVGMV